MRTHVSLPSELGDGHYWADEDIVIRHPLKLIGDDHNQSNVVVELSGSFKWKARSGYCEGITLRRPKLASQSAPHKSVLILSTKSKLNMCACTLDQNGTSADVAIAGGSGLWERVILCGGRNGLVLVGSSRLTLESVRAHMVFFQHILTIQ